MVKPCALVSALLLCAAALSVFLAGCSGNPVDAAYGGESVSYLPAVSAEENIISIRVSTDKGLYHSDDVMNITVAIDALTSMDNYYLALVGIKAGGSPRLNELKQVSLDAGENMFFFQFRTPPCNRCSGIREGNYSISAELYHDNVEAMSAAKVVEILQ